MKKLLALFTLSLLAGLVFATPSPNTGQITFAWSYDFQANPGVTNFVVYVGRVSGTYTNTFNVGTNLSTTVSGLVRGATYYAAATAQSNVGLESDYSNEASNMIANKPPKPQAFTAQ